MFPIPGTKRIKYLIENAEAAKVKLSEKDLAEIRSILNEFPVAGARYFEQQMKLINADSI